MTEATSPIVVDLFRRSDRDQPLRRELDGLTVLDGTERRLKRGAIHPADAQNVLADLPKSALGALPEAIARWRSTLLTPPPADHLRLLDAAREFGSGVASWPRLRVLLLLRGPTDDPADDLVVELKELADSGTGGFYAPGVYYDSLGERVVRSARLAWARPDAEPLWGWTELLGLPCQIRLESEGQKNIRVARLAGDEGTPEAIASLGSVLGSILARGPLSRAGCFVVATLQPASREGSARLVGRRLVGSRRDTLLFGRTAALRGWAPATLRDAVRSSSGRAERIS